LCNAARPPAGYSPKALGSCLQLGGWELRQVPGFGDTPGAVTDLRGDRKPGREIGQLPGRRAKGAYASSQWHQLGAERYPPQSLFDHDVPRLIREWIVPGHAPAAGMLSTGDTIMTLGSCFALELRMYLERVGLVSNNFQIPGGLGNTFAILDFVSWCVTGEETVRGFRYDRTDEGDIREWTPEAEREEYLLEVQQAGAFVFAVGLAEVWEDRVTGGVFWRGVPEEIFDADRQLFRLSSVEENEANLVQIVELIRTVNPDAPIVLALSPAPLKATFGTASCLTADCVSKSILRVAIDRVVKLGLNGVYYWPLFEVTRWAGAHMPWRAYTHGRGSRDARHVSRYLIAEFMEAFVEAFYTPDAVAELRAKGHPVAHPPRSARGRLETLGAVYELSRNERRRKLETLRNRVRKRVRKRTKPLRMALQRDRRVRSEAPAGRSE
jgi:hypothetical protein